MRVRELVRAGTTMRSALTGTLTGTLTVTLTGALLVATAATLLVARPADAAEAAAQDRPAVAQEDAAAPKTVPFEVRGELPIFPKALWRTDSRGTGVRQVEARLIQLKLLDQRWLDESFGTMTRDAVRKFQAAHGIPPLGYVDRHTWDQLQAASRPPTRAELFPPAPVVNGKRLDQRCATGVALCVDKTTRKLRYVVNGAVKLQLDVRFGAEKTATREGAFTVNWKSRDHVSKLYDSAMPFAMFFSGGQAVHYSSDFAARGYAGASHGCVNVRDLAAITRLFDQVAVGDKVIVYRS